MIAIQKGCQFKGNSKEEWRGWLRAVLLNKLRRAANGDPIGEISINESSSRYPEIVAEHTPPPQKMLREEQFQRLAKALRQLREGEKTAVELNFASPPH
jgi:DNA-directed RNA polymerase specialized sigma24 family protein